MSSSSHRTAPCSLREHNALSQCLANLDSDKSLIARPYWNRSNVTKNSFSTPEVIFTFAGFKLDTQACQLIDSNGNRVDIALKAFELLQFLIRNRHRVVSQDELISAVWCVKKMSESTVPTAIRSVRRALCDKASNPRFIETVRARGYRFIEPTCKIEHADQVVARSAFVGRVSELARLHSALAAAMDGQPTLVRIVGSAGIGKTRLAQEFSRELERKGARIARSAALPQEIAPPRWPWVQLVRSFARGMPTDRLNQLDEASIQYLCLLDAEFGTQITHVGSAPELEPDQMRLRMAHAIAKLAILAAEDTNCLLVILEDLHLAGPDTLELLASILLEVGDSRILFLATYRPRPLIQNEATVQALDRLATHTSEPEIILDLLADADIRLLVQSKFAPEDSADLEDWLIERSGGNPFFFEQLTSAARQHRLTALPVAPTSSAEVPTGIKVLVRWQVQALPEPTRNLLEFLAAHKRPLSAADLATLSEIDLGDVSIALEHAVECDLIRASGQSPPTWEFRHGLIRDAVYECTPAKIRSRVHREIADWLEHRYSDDIPPNAASIAHHLVATGSPDVLIRAANHNLLAASWATRCLAHDSAHPQIRSAIESFEAAGTLTPVRRCELTLALGEGERDAGAEGYRQTLDQAYLQARSLGRTDIQAKAAVALAQEFFASRVGIIDELVISRIEEALDTLPSGASRLRAFLLARLAIALVWTGDDQKIDDLTAEAIEESRRSGDRDALRHALCARHAALWHPSRREERRALIDMFGNELTGSALPGLKLMHILFGITYHLEQGDMIRAGRDVAKFAGLAESLSLPHFLWQVKLFESNRMLREGAFSEAEVTTQLAFNLGARAQSHNAIHSCGAQLIVLRWEQGRADEVVENAQSYFDQYPSVVAWRGVQAIFNAELGRVDDARRQIAQIRASGFGSIPTNEAWLASLDILAMAAAELNDTESASELFDLLLPSAGLVGGVGFAIASWGSQARILGQLATTLRRYDEAIHYLRTAAETEDHIGALPWLAHSFRHLAVCLRLRNQPGDSIEAHDFDNKARTLAIRFGMTNLARKLPTD